MKLLAIVGPTASGKTRMAVEVALALRAQGFAPEIVSCDSMGVYRGIDIAADKPSAAERGGIAHHLFDIADPTEDVTAVQYRDLARAVIADIDRRAGVAMLAGGSGLWFLAVVDDLEFAPTSKDLRRRLEAADPAELYERLQGADPERAAAIDPRNARRIVRAVEILELTGRPPSELRTSWERRSGPYDLSVCGITWDRTELFERAAERVRSELDAGLVDEVRLVAVRGLSRTARQALGAKEMLDYLEGLATLEDATATLIRNTKSFIRRQLSWFRADPRVEWTNLSKIGWDAGRDEIVARFGDALQRMVKC
jgi:tRNA dimethylallyltransferase